MTASNSTDDESLKALISRITDEVRSQVPKLRLEAYAIAGFWEEGRGKVATGPRVGRDLTPSPESELVIPERRQGDSVDAWAEELERWAIGLQSRAEAMSMHSELTTENLLRVTDNAGRLLGATERLMSAYRIGCTTPIDGPPPSSLVLSRVMTIVATARDHVNSALGMSKNLRQRMGREEALYLLLCFVVAASIYVMAHPTWGFLTQPLLPSSKAAFWAGAAPFWEITFWAIFGSMAYSYLQIAEDTSRGSFDPRNSLKYYYRIPTAPIVAIVIIFLWSSVGSSLSSGGTASTIFSGSFSPNPFVLIGVSFLLGFFSKGALDLLDRIWRQVAPSSAASGGGGESTGRKAGEEGSTGTRGSAGGDHDRDEM